MRRKLYKSSLDKKMMGVCGGLGDYFNIDPTIIRVLFLFAFFCYSSGLWLYLALGIVLPYDYQVKTIQTKETNFFGNLNRTQTSNSRKDVTPDNEDKWSDF